MNAHTNVGDSEVANTNVRNVMIHFLGTFSSVASAVLWLVGDVALIGSEITVVGPVIAEEKKMRRK
jgi:hypothetical protein